MVAPSGAKNAGWSFLFWFLFVLVFLTVLFNTYWVMKYSNRLTELNPVGRYLMKYGGQLLFAAFKLILSMVSLAYIYDIRRQSRVVSLIIVMTLAIFEVAILVFQAF